MTETNVLIRKSNHAARSMAMPSQISLALEDISFGLKRWQLWLFLGWNDIKIHYRRSVLGPFWITLSMAVTVFSMGLLYGKLFKMDLDTYFPYLATGLLSWNLLSNLILEGMNIFVDAEGLIKQIKQPYSLFVFRVVSRVFIVFFHHIVILLPIIIFFHLKLTLAFLFLPISLLLVWLNGVAYGSILSMISARFRDIKPIVSSLIQVTFFLTPVLWSSALIPPQYQYIININPFAQFLALLRAPLLGEIPTFYTLFVTFGITGFGLISAFCFFVMYRSRISYWI